MAVPKTLSYNDLFNGKAPAPEYGTLQKGARTVTSSKTKDKDKKKKKKKLTKSQQRIATTSIGKGVPKIGGVDEGGFYEIENPDKSNRGLLVEGMQNRTPRVRNNVPSRSGIQNIADPTLYQMLPKTDYWGDPAQGFNFANPAFSQSRAPKQVGVQRTVSSRIDEDGRRRMQYTDPVFSQPVSAREQSARSRGAAQSARTQISDMKKLYSGIDSMNVNRDIYTPSLKYGGKQDLFSQNIKLLSGGFSLTDTKARDAIRDATAESAARVKRINQQKLKDTLADHRSPASGIAEANRILAEQGANYRFKSDVRRRRAGRYVAEIIKVYHGPSTRQAYTRIIHNGRRVTAYRGLSPGQRLGGGDPYSVINKYHKDQAVVDFAIENTDIKPTGKYYDPSLSASSITTGISRLNNLRNSKKRVYKTTPKWAKVNIQSRGSGPMLRRYGPAVLRTVNGKRGYYVKTGTTGRYVYETRGLSAAEEKQLAKLNSQRPKAGSAGKAAFAAHVEREAGKKKAKLDTMIDPLDSIYSYAAVTDEQMDEFSKYGGDLRSNITEFDTNIETLKQGIAKVNVARGKAGKARDVGGAYYGGLVGSPLGTLDTSFAAITGQKQAVVAKEASRGVSLTAAKKKSLTTKINKLNSDGKRGVTAARKLAAQAANYRRSRHSKYSYRQSLHALGAKQAVRAAQNLAAANAKLAEAKRWTTYRDTGVDPGQITTAQATTQIAGFDTQLGDIGAAQDFFRGGGQELSIGGKVVAKRGQAGLIDVIDQSAFTNLGITVPTALTKQKTDVTATKFSTLEKAAEDRQATQVALIAELKTVQKERIKENAAARVAQINRLVETRTVNRREAQRMKADIAKEVAASNKAITSVDDSVPIPDITEFDTDLRSEASKILDETEGIIKSTSKAKAQARLRQVTRGRKPQGSPVGAVLRPGAVVPRPRQQQRSTSLGTITTNLRNPFVR